MIACVPGTVFAGGLFTVKVFEAVLPVPPMTAPMAPLTLLSEPEAVALTSIETVQELLAGMDPPEYEIVVPPALASNVPPQVVFTTVKGEAFSMPNGYVSEKPTPVIAPLEFGFVMVNVRVDTPVSRIGLGEKSFVIVGSVT